MRLKRAANWFNQTSIYTWDGTTFVDSGVRGNLQVYDRFVSEREFGIKRRMLLVNPDTPLSGQVIRVGISGPVYLRGEVNRDIQIAEYSLIYLLHLARFTGQLVELQKSYAASGMAKGVQDHSLGTFHCDYERVTFSNSTEFSQVRVTDATVTLPAGAPANAEHEFIVDGKRYVLQEVYTTAGFLQARAQEKNA